MRKPLINTWQRDIYRQVDTAKEDTFLAHFPVVRTDKDITKTIIVFDTSVKKDETAVNDLRHAGPKLQKDLFDVLIQFRRNVVAVVFVTSVRCICK